MKSLLLYLIFGIIGVECTIYYIIPSELSGIKLQNKMEIMILFFTIVPAYFILWFWCVFKKTYAKENSDEQWSKISILLVAFIFQFVWFIILSYNRNRVSFALSGSICSISFIVPILRINEINKYIVKIFFLFVSIIQIIIILWVSIEFIIYEKFITYCWIAAYYFYPIYLGVFSGLFVLFLRIEENDTI